MKSINITIAVGMFILVTACSKKINIDIQNNENIEIFPDYKDVTIPSNIAPLNFSIDTKDDARLLISDGKYDIWIADNNGNFDIPIKKWKKILKQNEGHSIKYTVCIKHQGKWISYKPFTMSIAKEPIDSYVAYRLIPPGYVAWNEMGIYQRCLENYEQSSIIENYKTDGNCMNCHSFCMQNPDKMLFHSRAVHPGTMVITDGKIEKLNTKTDHTISSLVYPSWHPSGEYVAFSTNATNQSFFANHKNRIEVYDKESDVVVYDVKQHKIITCNKLNSSDNFETFPTFSPDGKSLYFCSSVAIDSMPEKYNKAHYSLCKISFDPKTLTFGNIVDTIYNARQTGRSVSFPRISPDGKFLVFTLHDFGNFSIWHHEADLYCAELSTGKVFPLTAANSNDTESYHSWSHNSRWLIFSSRRINGLYTCPFITYIDTNGTAHKPFLLPQRNARKYYSNLMFSYNIPEFIISKVKINHHELIDSINNSIGINVE